MKKGNSGCCSNPNCNCPTGQCNCGPNCSCGDKECKGCSKVQSYEYSTTKHYSNIGGKEEYEGEIVKRHMINDNTQEQVIKEKLLPNGKTLVTKEIREGNEIKKVDQYVKDSGNQPSIQ